MCLGLAEIQYKKFFDTTFKEKEQNNERERNDSPETCAFIRLQGVSIAADVPYCAV